MLKTHYPYHLLHTMVDRDVGSWVVFVGDDVCEGVDGASVGSVGRSVGRSGVH